MKVRRLLETFGLSGIVNDNVIVKVMGLRNSIYYEVYRDTENIKNRFTRFNDNCILAKLDLVRDYKNQVTASLPLFRAIVSSTGIITVIESSDEPPIFNGSMKPDYFKDSDRKKLLEYVYDDAMIRLNRKETTA